MLHNNLLSTSMYCSIGDFGAPRKLHNLRNKVSASNLALKLGRMLYKVPRRL